MQLLNVCISIQMGTYNTSLHIKPRNITNVVNDFYPLTWTGSTIGRAPLLFNPRFLSLWQMVTTSLIWHQTLTHFVLVFG